MDLQYNNGYKLIITLMKHSPYPKEIREMVKCTVRINKSPTPTFHDSCSIELLLGNFQSFVRFKARPHKNIEAIRLVYQYNFNRAVKDLLILDEEVCNIYPELVI